MKSTARVCLIVMLVSLFVPLLTAGAASVDFKEAGGFFIPAHISSGSDGRVYVVDEETNALWRINPSTGDYEKFFPSGSLMDAVPDNAGKIWWTDGNDTFGYFDLKAAEISMNSWVAPEDAQQNPPYLGPLAVMGGKIWMANYASTLFGIYSFTPAGNGGELCHYLVTGGSYATDLVVENGRLWWLSSKPGFGQLISFTPGTNTGRLVRYPFNRNVGARAGMLGDQGSLWWAEDALNGDLYRFNPNTGTLTTFDLPARSQPLKVAKLGTRIWFTDPGQDTDPKTDGWFGSLDPGTAPGVDSQLIASDTVDISPTCYTLGAAVSVVVEPIPGTLTWSPGSSEVTQPQTGLERYALPAGASPLGIAAVGNSIWVGDDGRNKIVNVKFQSEYNLYLPAVRK